MKKRILALLLAAVMAFSLVACASAPDAEAPKNDKTENKAPGQVANPEDHWDTPYEEKQTLTIARVGVGGNNLPEGDVFEDNQWIQWCEKKLNIDIEFAYVAADSESFNQRVNLMMSSELPDCLVVGRDQYLAMVEADLLADMTDIIPAYSSPLVADYYNSWEGRIMDYASVDGRVYAIPDTVGLGGQPLLWVRGDWREKLGLPVPETVDDIFTIANAFATQDPDGNGVDDTVGLLGDKLVCANWGAFTYDPIFAAYDAFPKSFLKDENGNVIYGSVQPEAREALERLAAEYQAGNIDPEIASSDWNSDYGKMTSNKAGIYFYPWHGAWAACDALKTNPDAKWEMYAAPVNDEGKVVSVSPEPISTYIVVNKNYEHPELVMKLLSTEYQGIRYIDEEANEIYKDLGVSWLNWPLPIALGGNSGAFTLHGGAQTVIDAYESGNTDGLDADKMMKLKDYAAYREKSYEEDPGAWANGFAFENAALFTGNEKFELIDQAYYGKTETMLMKWANLDKMEQETYLKILTGEKPIEEFDKFVEKWYAEGGQEVLDEIAEAIG